MPNRTLHLTLHGIGTPPGTVSDCERPYWLSVALFERLLWQMPVIETAYSITVALTFDDANKSDLETALPLLAAHGRRALFFIPTGLIGAPDHLTAGDIRSLDAAGMGIGSHGHSHLDLRSCDDAALAVETVEARRRLEDILGKDVRDLSFPFGLFDARVVKAAHAAGFRRLFSSSGGFASAEQGLIARTTIRSSFLPERDLEALAGPIMRYRTSLLDRLRRIKYEGLAAL